LVGKFPEVLLLVVFWRENGMLIAPVAFVRDTVFIFYCCEMVFLVLIGVGLIGLTGIYFFRGSFVAELAISFLPYWAMGLLFLAIVLLVVLVRRIWKK
jgi:hypothetical protein